MNRRSIIQALGLAPLAALISGKAEAAPDTVSVSEREKWEADKARWNERKLFTLTATVPADAVEAMGTWNPGFLEQETLPFFENLGNVVMAVTNTPDITAPATFKLFDKNGNHWGPTKEEYGARFPQKSHHVDENIDVVELFRKGAFRLRQRVLIQARNIVEMGMPVEEVLIGHMMPSPAVARVTLCAGWCSCNTRFAGAVVLLPWTDPVPAGWPPVHVRRRGRDLAAPGWLRTLRE
jgi:hypothetical protein